MSCLNRDLLTFTDNIHLDIHLHHSLLPFTYNIHFSAEDYKYKPYPQLQPIVEAPTQIIYSSSVEDKENPYEHSDNEENCVPGLTKDRNQQSLPIQPGTVPSRGQGG